jgi:hypothetical protein
MGGAEHALIAPTHTGHTALTQQGRSSSFGSMSPLKLGLVGLLLVYAGLAAALEGETDYPKPVSRSARNIEGWTVRVDDRLLATTNQVLGSRALKLLEAKLADITYIVPENKLTRLRTVVIVLDLTYGRLRAMQYHPSADWLAAHGYDTNLAKCVHICAAADFARARQVNEQPWVVLHELAHAYHDQVLGFDEPRIRQAYQRYKAGGYGERVLRFDGARARHYAVTDHKEFFAEMTETYFGLNDFFPFNRAELMTAQPEIYELMRSIWGPP